MDTIMTNDRRKQIIRQVKSILAVTSFPIPTPFFSSPRAHRATLWALPAVVLGFVTSSLTIAIFVAMVIFVVTWNITPAETWNERFYKLLAAYHPLDEGAYQELLGKIKSNTGNRNDIMAWLNVEIAQVERPIEAAAEKTLLDTRLRCIEQSMPANILNLPAYTVTALEQNDHDYHIDAAVKEAPKTCPHCQSSNLVGFGHREQVVRDLPTHGRRVGLYIDTRRYQCRACSKTFYETLPDIDERRPMTSRLVAWIGKQAIKRTFASIAEEVGLDEKSVRSVFRDYVYELEKTIRFETPKWMGIDEIHLIHPRGVIANIQNNTIVELLPNRNKDTVVRFLHHLDGKERIQYVAMDMWQPYRDACIAVIPDAQIVIDKFHVVRMANDAIERVMSAALLMFMNGDTSLNDPRRARDGSSSRERLRK